MGGNSFGWALNELQKGLPVTRSGWNGRGMWIALQKPDENSKMKRPYIYISIVGGELVPWCPSHSDLLGTDWHHVD